MKNNSSSNEVAHLKQIERELQVRLLQQSAITTLSQLALTTNDLEAFMAETLQTMVQILEVELGKILELLPDGRELLVLAGTGWKEGIVGNTRISAGKETQAGYALLSGEPVIVADLQKETRFEGSALLADHGVTSGMSVIIPGKSRPFGVLEVHTTQARTFTPDDTNFLQGVANLLASAIERIQTQEALRSSRDQLAFILQNVADGITAQNSRGELIYANRAAARVIGFSSEEELLGTPVAEILGRFELLDEQGRPFPFERLPGRLALQSGREESATLRFRTQTTGEEHWSVVKSKPVINQAGEADLVVNIFQDITELKRSEQAQHLLAEAVKLFSDTLNYETTLTGVAQLAVPDLADWCSVHIVEENETVRQLAVAHADPQKVELVLDLQRRYPPDENASAGLAKVLRTGQPEFYPEITDQMIEQGARDAEHLRLLRELGLKSGIVVPLVARGRSLGAISLVWAESGRNYTPSDVALVEELARRAAIAIDNARLYQEAQKLNADLEGLVAKRTSQLQTMITKLRSEVNDRKRAEDALRKSEAMLQSLFESAPDAIVLVDEAGNIIRVNAQAEQMFGYRREALLGQQIDIFLPERFWQRHSLHRPAFFEEPRARPMGIDLELFGKHQDGHEFPIDIMLSPIQSEDGRMVISAIRDITQRREAERALREREAELAEVQRRLLDSVEAERLHLSQELHDGPIQELYGLTYELKELEETLEKIETVDPRLVGTGYEFVSSSAGTLKHVIDHLRSICGELRPPALAPFGLEKAIQAHIETIQEKYPDLTARLDLMEDGQILPERVRLALYRIFQHAVSNVVRHSQAKELHVRFAFDDKTIILELEDDGCGFELPTRWVDLARSGHLGLVGTVERAQAIGGQLKIESSPGKGTLVRVIVPQQGLLDTATSPEIKAT